MKIVLDERDLLKIIQSAMRERLNLDHFDYTIKGIPVKVKICIETDEVKNA